MEISYIRSLHGEICSVWDSKSELLQERSTRTHCSFLKGTTTELILTSREGLVSSGLAGEECFSPANFRTPLDLHREQAKAIEPLAYNIYT